MSSTDHPTPHERAAYNLGREHAISAASWAADPAHDADDYRRILAMLDAGDPAADEYLPARPDLSGEWADGMTPRRLADDVSDALGGCDAGWVPGLCDAYEAGVADHFEAECERLLREALS